MKLGDELPWDEIEKNYNACLNNERKGAGNKPARMVIGALIVKHEMRLSDEDSVEIIKENPYMQYMLGPSEFSDEPIFDPSLFVYIRKRLKVDDFNKFTESLVKKSKINKEKTDNQDSNNENYDKPSHNGTLKVDATCSNAEVRFPTDLDLLHDGYEVIERIIDRFCKIAHFHRPDTHMDHFSWDAYNESEDLKTHIEAYLRRFGVLPAMVEADKIYLNRDNRKLLKDLNIECCGKPLRRPSKDMQTSDYEKKMAKYSTNETR